MGWVVSVPCGVDRRAAPQEKSNMQGAQEAGLQGEGGFLGQNS